jgi:hypothetical protein
MIELRGDKDPLSLPLSRERQPEGEYVLVLGGFLLAWEY